MSFSSLSFKTMNVSSSNQTNNKISVMWNAAYIHVRDLPVTPLSTCLKIVAKMEHIETEV